MGQCSTSYTWIKLFSVLSNYYSVKFSFNEYGLNKLEMHSGISEKKAEGEPPVGVLSAYRWLVDYFKGQNRAVDFPIDWVQFTPFQRCTLEEVYAIPYGEVATYKAIAIRICKPSAIRAVAHANATNPLPIVIPCHRVIGSDRLLHGYSGPGGLEFKAFLLRLEGLSLDRQRVV